MHPLTKAIPVCWRLTRPQVRQLRPIVPRRRYDGPIPDRPPIGVLNLPAKEDVPPDSHDFWRENMYPIQRPSDPAGSSRRSHPRFFDFLHPTAKAERPEWKYANPIHPPTADVPWPTSLSHSFQSKYWDRTGVALRAFLRDDFPRGPWTYRPQLIEYVDDAVDSTVSFVANVFPTCRPHRLRMLAKMYAVLLMHEDLVDLGNLQPHNENDDEPAAGDLSKVGLNSVASDLLGESPLQGRRLLTSMREWASLGTSHPDMAKDLDRFILYRIQAVGVDLVFRNVEFACDLHLSSPERDSLKVFNNACAEHFILTNDLYSYARHLANTESGTTPSNIVFALQKSGEMPPDEAKTMVRENIWETEQDIYNRYTALLNEYGDRDIRTTYARGVIIALAGNMFHSATCARNAKHVESSTPEDYGRVDRRRRG